MEAVYAPLRSASRELVLAAISEHAAKTAVKLYFDESGFFAVVKRAWNWLCVWMGQPEMQVVIDAGVMALLIRLGVPPKMAKVLATGIRLGAKSAAESQS